MNSNKEIKNKMAYFYIVLKNMDNKENMKQAKINEHEISLNEKLYSNTTVECDIDAKLAESNLTGWIELIENEDLHKAVKSLSVEDQIFLSYIIKEQRTQRELEEIYHIKHQNICKKHSKIIKKLQEILSKK